MFSSVNLSEFARESRFQVRRPPFKRYRTARPTADLDVPPGMIQFSRTASRILACGIDGFMCFRPSIRSRSCSWMCGGLFPPFHCGSSLPVLTIWYHIFWTVALLICSWLAIWLKEPGKWPVKQSPPSWMIRSTINLLSSSLSAFPGSKLLPFLDCIMPIAAREPQTTKSTSRGTLNCDHMVQKTVITWSNSNGRERLEILVYSPQKMMAILRKTLSSEQRKMVNWQTCRVMGGVLGQTAYISWK